jgi:hypothetical protein
MYLRISIVNCPFTFIPPERTLITVVAPSNLRRQILVQIIEAFAFVSFVSITAALIRISSYAIQRYRDWPALSVGIRIAGLTAASNMITFVLYDALTHDW